MGDFTFLSGVKVHDERLRAAIETLGPQKVFASWSAHRNFTGGLGVSGTAKAMQNDKDGFFTSKQSYDGVLKVVKETKRKEPDCKNFGVQVGDSIVAPVFVSQGSLYYACPVQVPKKPKHVTAEQAQELKDQLFLACYAQLQGAFSKMAEGERATLLATPFGTGAFGYSMAEYLTALAEAVKVAEQESSNKMKNLHLVVVEYQPKQNIGPKNPDLEGVFSDFNGEWPGKVQAPEGREEKGCENSQARSVFRQNFCDAVTTARVEALRTVRNKQKPRVVEGDRQHWVALLERYPKGWNRHHKALAEEWSKFLKRTPPTASVEVYEEGCALLKKLPETLNKKGHFYPIAEAFKAYLHESQLTHLQHGECVGGAKEALEKIKAVCKQNSTTGLDVLAALDFKGAEGRPAYDFYSNPHDVSHLRVRKVLSELFPVTDKNISDVAAWHQVTQVANKLVGQDASVADKEKMYAVLKGLNSGQVSFVANVFTRIEGQPSTCFQAVLQAVSLFKDTDFSLQRSSAHFSRNLGILGNMEEAVKADAATDQELTARLIQTLRDGFGSSHGQPSSGAARDQRPVGKVMQRQGGKEVVVGAGVGL